MKKYPRALPQPVLRVEMVLKIKEGKPESVKERNGTSDSHRMAV